MSRYILYSSHPDNVTARWRKSVARRKRGSTDETFDYLMAAALGLRGLRASKPTYDDIEEFVAFVVEHCPSAAYVSRKRGADGVCFELKIANANEAFSLKMRWL